jgi:hypothetical protein
VVQLLKNLVAVKIKLSVLHVKMHFVLSVVINGTKVVVWISMSLLKKIGINIGLVLPVKLQLKRQKVVII